MTLLGVSCSDSVMTLGSTVAEVVVSEDKTQTRETDTRILSPVAYECSLWADILSSPLHGLLHWAHQCCVFFKGLFILRERERERVGERM